MPEESRHTEGIEPEETQPLGANPLPEEYSDAAGASPPPRLPWRRIAVVAGGAFITTAGAVVATLAATQKTAVHENAKAYAHGMNDALQSIREELRNGVDPFDI
jgi:hypothetical protein